MTGPVGLLGLGAMGRPIGGHVAAAGFELIGFDPAGTHERLPVAARAAKSATEVLTETEVVLLSLPDGAAVRSVVDLMIDREGDTARVVVDLSTIGPTVAAEAADALAAVGVTYTDGPVSGGVSGAVAGTVALMYAGPEQVLANHRSLLESFSRVFFVGEAAGQGQAMKLLNNFLSATAMAATSEAIVLGEAYGLDLPVMLDVLNASSGRNTATYDKFPNQVVTGAYATGFRTDLMTKDVLLYMEAVRAVGRPAAIGAATTDVWQRCSNELPGSDFSEIYRFVRSGAGGSGS